MTSYVTKEKYQELLDKYKHLLGDESVEIVSEDLEMLAKRENIKTWYEGIKDSIRDTSNHQNKKPTPPPKPPMRKYKTS